MKKSNQQPLSLAIQDGSIEEVENILQKLPGCQKFLELLKLGMNNAYLRAQKELKNGSHNWEKLLSSDNNKVNSYFLEMGVRAGDASFVKKLINLGVSIHRNENETPFLHIAAQKYDADMMQVLIQAGADSKYRTQAGYFQHIYTNKDLLALVQCHAQTKTKQKLQKNSGSWVESVFYVGKPLERYFLETGVMANDAAFVKTLIEFGVSIHHNENETPFLHIAAQSHDIAMLDVLIAAGANLQWRNQGGYNALGVALANTFILNLSQTHPPSIMKTAYFLLHQGIQLPAVDLGILQAKLLSREHSVRILKHAIALNTGAQSIAQNFNKAKAPQNHHDMMQIEAGDTNIPTMRPF